MQVVDVAYSESQMIIATIDKSFEPNVEIGMKLKTKSNYEFVLNFTKKYPDLVVPPEAKAIYANCGDLIPVAEEVQTINVGKNYKEPIITIGIGKDEKEIGKADVDENGKIVNPVLTEKVLGFVAPKVKDKAGLGGGAVVVLLYEYAGPIKVKEILAGLPTSQTYIDCVGHPMLEQ